MSLEQSGVSNNTTTMDVLRAAYVSLPGSLIHPILMACIITGWAYALVLGLSANVWRRERIGAQLLGSGSGGGGGGGDRSPTGKRHHKVAAGLLLATLGVMVAGMLNTYLRAGRLFPGPHLYGGFLVLLALCAQAALVPWFADAKATRSVHLLGGLVASVLLLSQLWTGVGLTTSLVSGFLSK